MVQKQFSNKPEVKMMKYIAVILVVMLLMSPLLADDAVYHKRVSPNGTSLVNTPPAPIQNARVYHPSTPKQVDTESILLVDDDGGANNGGTYTDIQSYFTDALDEASYAYDYYIVSWTTPPSDGPNESTMAQYDCVIWFTGETWGGGIPGRRDVLTANDEDHLAAYLDSGGSLFLNAQDYLYNSYPSAGQFSAGQFPYDYLGVASTVQDMYAPPISVAGATGGFAQGLSYTVLAPYDSATIWADKLVPRLQKLLNADGTQDAVAVQYHSGTFYTTFSACGVEGLVNGTHQVSEFMAAIMSGFGIAGVTQTHQPTVVTHYSLAQNYPNPFNPTTDIRYQLPAPGKVTLTVFNVLGQEVAKLIDEPQAPGSYQVSWNAGNLPSGVYFYRLAANGFQDIRQMMLVK
jgi:hypothetical protein